MNRCPWVGQNKPFYEAYHDQEWAVPVYDEQRHFEMLILEGAQAGLSWETILKRREGYREAFCQFDPLKVAAMSDQDLEQQLSNPKIIRNRLKVFSTRDNARAFLEIQAEFGSFNQFVWSFVNGEPQINRPATMAEVPSQSPAAEALSKALKQRGMRFVGPTIIYAYMQAVGLVNDHLQSCYCCP